MSFNILSIQNQDDVIRHKAYLDTFEKMYLKYFPMDDEREDFENIINRISGGNLPPTFINLAIMDNKVIGGIVVDYYPECNSIEPIYLAVDELYRRHGVGKKLIEYSTTNNPNVKHTFLECDNPSLVSVEESAMDPAVRLNMYIKMGFSIIPIDYVQPPLSEEKDYERKLLLLHKGVALNADDLIAFLSVFYEYLGYKTSSELDNMIKKINYDRDRLFLNTNA